VCEDAAMRAVLLGVLVAGVWLCSSCSKSAAAAVRGDGTLILQVGGGEDSIRAALAAAGVAMGPPQRLRDVDLGPAIPEAPPKNLPPERQPAPLPGPGEVDPQRGDPQPDLVDPPPAPPVEPPTYQIVKLRRGQTLIHLAKEYLGNGNRFRDLLTLNGWTEAQARRLAEGQPVKVPIARADKPRRE
jgi:hypothetical protein